MNLKYLFALLAFALTAASCEKSISIDPPIDQMNSALVFEDDLSATAAVNGIYSNMMIQQEQIFNSAITLYSGLCADELFYYSSTHSHQEFFKNEISVITQSTIQRNIWTPAYKYIYAANSCIEGLEASTGLSAAVRDQLLGEAKFIRALSFFYLVQFFGDVPLTLSTDYAVNEKMARTDRNQVYAQILQDLKDAEAVLPVNYPGAERTRPIKWAATALLARFYLYTGDWAAAEASASSVIAAPHYILHSNLNDVFLGTSQEAIWQLRPVSPSRNTFEGRIIIPSTAASQPTYLVSPGLLASFDPADKRKTDWTKQHVFAGQTYYYPYKYKVRGVAGVPVTEYYTVLRLAEMYLIRAEARIRQNQLGTGQNDLNILRARAGVGPLNLVQQADLLQAVEDERRWELFAELGHRWFDLIRTGRADTILSAKGPEWQATDKLWPIPQEEIDLNPSLSQNPGY